MPFGNGTGPNGMGPMTGRAAGNCAGYSVPGYMNPGIGGRGPARGYGRGIGRGMAWRGPGYGRGRFGGYAPVPPPAYGAPYPVQPAYGSQYGPQFSAEDEAAMLRDQAAYMEEQLKSIQERMSELEAKKEEE